MDLGPFAKHIFKYAPYTKSIGQKVLVYKKLIFMNMSQ